MSDVAATLARVGYVHVGPFLEPAQVTAINAGIDRLAPESGPYGVMLHNLWRQLPVVEELIRSPRVTGMVRRLTGLDEVVLFQDVLVWKPPGTKTIEWHQDYSYWPLSAPRGVTLWVALDDADPENGCLHYVPTSHAWGERQPADFVKGATQPDRPLLPPLDVEAHADEAVAAPCRTGELLAHDPLTWHMSPPNHTGRQRRAWTSTWLAADVTWDLDHANHPFNHTIAPPEGGPLQGELFPRFGGSG